VGQFADSTLGLDPIAEDLNKVSDSQNNDPRQSKNHETGVFKVIAFIAAIGLALIFLNSIAFKDSGISNVDNQENQSNVDNQENQISLELEKERAIREYERCFDRKYNAMLLQGGYPGVAEMHARTWCGKPPY
jgi:hypothetical protein